MRSGSIPGKGLSRLAINAAVSFCLGGFEGVLFGLVVAGDFFGSFFLTPARLGPFRYPDVLGAGLGGDGGVVLRFVLATDGVSSRA